MLSLSAQENFNKGYIVSHNKDTIHGLIDYRNWKTNPEYIKFKNNNGEQEKALRPNDILEFSVLDESYISAKVNVGIRSDNIGYLDQNSTLDSYSDTVFLQTLYKGEKSLFLYHNKGIDHFYILTEKGFDLLIYKKYINNLNIRNLSYLI